MNCGNGEPDRPTDDAGRLSFMDFIFIHGAPGTGKSSVAKGLHDRLICPWFEFGCIPEFRQKKDLTLSCDEEEAFAFENLVLVARNYSADYLSPFSAGDTWTVFSRSITTAPGAAPRGFLTYFFCV
jgi:hypothetical protein